MSPHAYLGAGKTPAPAIFCGKVGFTTRGLARKALNNMAKTQTHPAATGQNDRTKLNAYLCNSCKNWHIGHGVVRP